MMGFGGMYGGYRGFGMGIIGWVLQIAVLIGVVYLVIYLVRSISRHSDHSPRERSALDILAERFARGEISEDEYKRMKDVLK